MRLLIEACAIDEDLHASAHRGVFELVLCCLVSVSDTFEVVMHFFFIIYKRKHEGALDHHNE